MAWYQPSYRATYWTPHASKYTSVGRTEPEHQPYMLQNTHRSGAQNRSNSGSNHASYTAPSMAPFMIPYWTAFMKCAAVLVQYSVRLRLIPDSMLVMHSLHWDLTYYINASTFKTFRRHFKFTTSSKRQRHADELNNQSWWSHIRATFL